MSPLGRKASNAGLLLSPGDRLGPYRIVGPVGVGGMGEVHRAHDPRLRRDVAIKVLHHTAGGKPEHVERLLKEARAAGSLNHPNIVAVFDVGTQGPLPYVVMELLEGESLRARLTRAPIPYKKALEYGIQMARALGAAHERGIWHRDVKPGNVFLTADGRLKLLDFGLVGHWEPVRGVGVRSPDAPTADDTGPLVHGTLGYMSPEQLLGEDVDHRTDLFALGAVLYEMLCGAPAYHRTSVPETTRAVLAEDPAELLGKADKLPKTAVAVLQRCLEKNREERYQSARDLAFHLQQLQDPAESVRATRDRVRARRLVLAAVLGTATVAGAASWLLLGFRSPVPSFQQVTFSHGRIGGACFASAGGTILYSEARDGKRLEVWWLSGLESPEARSLGHSNADVFSFRAGKVALSLGRRFVFGERFSGKLAEAPLGEAKPLVLAADVEAADWDPAGKGLVIVRATGAGDGSRLEYPPGRTLFGTSGSIASPRFARDGRRVAFVEDPTGRGVEGRVAVVDLEGQARALTGSFPSVKGLAWSPAGDEIWFAAGPWRTNRALRSVDLKRRQRVILETTASLTLWDITGDGLVLLSQDQERSALVGVSPGETSERDLSWFDTSGLAALSDDGRAVLFDDRFGVYIRPTDGSPPVRLGLTDARGDAFSPDGRSVLATASGRQLLIVPAGLGGPTPLPTHGFDSYRGSLWLPDGRRILFNGTRPGGNLRSYLQDLDGGPPSALTPDNTWVLAISPDGKLAAAIGGPSDGITLWPLAGGPPVPVRSSLPGDRPVAWSADGRWLWSFRRGEVPAEVVMLEVAGRERRLWKRLRPSDPAGVYSINNVRVTPTGTAYAYSYKRTLSHLYVARGLR